MHFMIVHSVTRYMHYGKGYVMINILKGGGNNWPPNVKQKWLKNQNVIDLNWEKKRNCIKMKLTVLPKVMRLTWTLYRMLLHSLQSSYAKEESSLRVIVHLQSITFDGDGI